MILFCQCIVLVSMICTSFHNGLFFCNFCILLLLLGKCAVSTSLVPRTVHIGSLLAFAFDIPFFPLSFSHRVCPSIFVCTVILVRVLFLFRRSNCLNHLIDRTCNNGSSLLLCRPSCRFFEFSSLVHSRLLICRLQIRTSMLTIRLVLHSRILSSFPPLVFSSIRLLLSHVFLLLSREYFSCLKVYVNALQSSLNSFPVTSVSSSVLMVCGTPFSVTYCSEFFFLFFLSVLHKCTPPAVCSTCQLKVICKTSGA